MVCRDCGQYLKTDWTYFEEVPCIPLRHIVLHFFQEISRLFVETITRILSARLVKFITSQIILSIFGAIYYFKTIQLFAALFQLLGVVFATLGMAYFHLMLYTLINQFFLNHNNFCELIS